MWFGTIERMTHVPAPLATADYSNVGFTASETLLNGGGWVRNSWTSHKEFGLSWGSQPRADTQIIKDYADGLYGEGPFFFVDPMAEKMNLLPSWWAAPMMGCLDAPPLIPGVIPTKVLTPTNTNNYPFYSALYSITGSPNADPGNSLVVPIPPDSALAVGVHGTFTGAGVVQVRGVRVDGSLGDRVNIPMIPVTGAEETNTLFLGSDFMALRLYVTRAEAVASTVTLSGIVAKVSLEDTTQGGFIGGRGNSGVSFVGAALEAPVGGRPDLSTIAVKFSETGGWEGGTGMGVGISYTRIESSKASEGYYYTMGGDPVTETSTGSGYWQ